MASPKEINTDYENKVFIADSRDMRELPDHSVGLIVTSPPYFNIKDYALDGHQKTAHSSANSAQIGDIAHFEEFISQLNNVWQECERVLRPNGKLIINVPLMPMLKKEFSTHENRHIFDLNSSIQQAILNNIPELYLMDTYIWNRTNPSKSLMFGSYPYPPNFYAQNTIEFVTVYVKSGPSFKPSKRQKELSALSQEEWVEFTSQIWNFPIPGKGDPAFGIHAALMPESIAERCIRLYSFVDDLVLDPFAGSGTTLRVAKRLGRKFVGYELVKNYQDIINTKLDADVCVKLSRRPIKKTKFAQQGNNKVPEILMNKVYHGDYSELLKKLPLHSVDLVCVDPPYNLKKGDWDTFKSDAEFLNFTFTWLQLVDEKLKPGGSIYIFNTPRNAAHILVRLESMGYQIQNWITWNKKDGFTSTKKRFLPEQETIVFATKPGGTPTFNADEVRVPYESAARIEAARNKGILKNGKRWYPNDKGRLCPDVWLMASERHVNKVQGKTVAAIHPTVKPLALMERIILASSNVGDVVLDIFAGSGSTLVAAKMHDRQYLGAEIDKEYVKLARKRLKDLE